MLSCHRISLEYASPTTARDGPAMFVRVFRAISRPPRSRNFYDSLSRDPAAHVGFSFLSSLEPVRYFFYYYYYDSPFPGLFDVPFRFKARCRIASPITHVSLLRRTKFFRRSFCRALSSDVYTTSNRLFPSFFFSFRRCSAFGGSALNISSLQEGSTLYRETDCRPSIFHLNASLRWSVVRTGQTRIWSLQGAIGVPLERKL